MVRLHTSITHSFWLMRPNANVVAAPGGVNGCR
jgi:hypothetical protein